MSTPERLPPPSFWRTRYFENSVMARPHRRTMTAANDLAGRAPAVCDRTGSHYEENSCPVVERIVHRDQPVGISRDHRSERLRQQNIISAQQYDGLKAAAEAATARLAASSS